MSSWDNEDSWFVLLTLTLFNIGDTIGRYAASVTCLQISRKPTLILNYGRTIFCVFFFLTAFEIGPSWLFLSDWFKFLNLFVFAVTNGFVSSLCVIMTPDCVP